MARAEVNVGGLLPQIECARLGLWVPPRASRPLAVVRNPSVGFSYTTSRDVLPEQIFRFFDPNVKSPILCGLVAAALALNGCGSGERASPMAQPNPPAVQQPGAESQPVAESIPLHADNVPEGGLGTPGSAIYGEVIAATDQIIKALEHTDSSTAADLRGAIQRFEVAARNWKLYAANMNSTEIAAIQQSQIAEHAVTSGEELRARILRVAHDPAMAQLQPELKNLLRALQQMMSATERSAFQRWVEENQLE